MGLEAELSGLCALACEVPRYARCTVQNNGASSSSQGSLSTKYYTVLCCATLTPEFRPGLGGLVGVPTYT